MPYIFGLFMIILDPFGSSVVSIDNDAQHHLNFNVFRHYDFKKNTNTRLVYKLICNCQEIFLEKNYKSFTIGKKLILVVMKTAKLAIVFVLLFTVQSCVNTKVVDVKSPCVSGKDGPCGPRMPVNTWLNEYTL